MDQIPLRDCTNLTPQAQNGDQLGKSLSLLKRTRPEESDTILLKPAHRIVSPDYFVNLIKLAKRNRRGWAYKLLQALCSNAYVNGIRINTKTLGTQYPDTYLMQQGLVDLAELTHSHASVADWSYYFAALDKQQPHIIQDLVTKHNIALPEALFQNLIKQASRATKAQRQAYSEIFFSLITTATAWGARVKYKRFNPNETLLPAKQYAQAGYLEAAVYTDLSATHKTPGLLKKALKKGYPKLIANILAHTPTLNLSYAAFLTAVSFASNPRTRNTYTQVIANCIGPRPNGARVEHSPKDTLEPAIILLDNGLFKLAFRMFEHSKLPPSDFLLRCMQLARPEIALRALEINPSPVNRDVFYFAVSAASKHKTNSPYHAIIESLISTHYASGCRALFSHIDGLTPAMYCLKKGLAKLALKMQYKDQNPLYEFVIYAWGRRRYGECIKALQLAHPGARRQAFRRIDKFGNTLLHRACAELNVELARYLISDRQCDIEMRNNKGHRPLHIARSASFLNATRRDQIINLLLERQSLPNCVARHRANHSFSHIDSASRYHRTRQRAKSEHSLDKSPEQGEQRAEPSIMQSSASTLQVPRPRY